MPTPTENPEVEARRLAERLYPYSTHRDPLPYDLVESLLSKAEQRAEKLEEAHAFHVKEDGPLVYCEVCDAALRSDGEAE